MEYIRHNPNETFKHDLAHNLTSDQITKFKQVLKEEKVEFFFLPSSQLKELVVQDSHPVLKQLPEEFKKGIMFGNSVDLSSRLVMQYLEDTLKEPYKSMMAMGEIRVKSQFDKKTSGEVVIPSNKDIL